MLYGLKSPTSFTGIFCLLWIWGQKSCAGHPEPVKKSDLKCISQNFETLACSWCPEAYPNIPLTRWTLRYKLNHEDKFASCSNYAEECQCYFGENWIKMETYDFLLTTLLVWTKVSKNETYKLTLSNKTVKPNPVEHLNTTSVFATLANVSWNPPSRLQSFTFVYQLNISSKYGNKTIYTSEPGVHLEGLHPYTDYEVQVTVRPDPPGYWSDAEALVFRTKMAGPSSPPPVLPQFFKLVGNNEAYVYWQKIPGDYVNGVVTRYKITNGDLTNYVEENNVYGNNIGIKKHKDNVVKIQAEVAGAEGEKLSPEAEIRIPIKGPPIPDIWQLEVNEVQKTLKFDWEYDGAHNTTFTLFECVASTEDNNQCALPPIATSLSAQKYQISPGHYRYTTGNKNASYVYGLAATVDGVSSGLPKQWLQRCYTDKAPSAPSEISVKSLNSNSLLISWTKSQCIAGKLTGKALNYTVEWTDPESNVARHVVPANQDEYEIKNLAENTEYQVRVIATGLAGSASKPAETYKTLKESTPLYWIIIPTVLIVIALVGAIVGIYCCRQKCKKNIDIEHPPKLAGQGSAIGETNGYSEAASIVDSDDQLMQVSEENQKNIDGYENKSAISEEDIETKDIEPLLFKKTEDESSNNDSGQSSLSTNPDDIRNNSPRTSESAISSASGTSSQNYVEQDRVEEITENAVNCSEPVNSSISAKLYSGLVGSPQTSFVQPTHSVLQNRHQVPENSIRTLALSSTAYVGRGEEKIDDVIDRNPANVQVLSSGELLTSGLGHSPQVSSVEPAGPKSNESTTSSKLPSYTQVRAPIQVQMPESCDAQPFQDTDSLDSTTTENPEFENSDTQTPVAVLSFNITPQLQNVHEPNLSIGASGESNVPSSISENDIPRTFAAIQHHDNIPNHDNNVINNGEDPNCKPEQVEIMMPESGSGVSASVQFELRDLTVPAADTKDSNNAQSTGSMDSYVQAGKTMF